MAGRGYAWPEGGLKPLQGPQSAFFSEGNLYFENPIPKHFVDTVPLILCASHHIWNLQMPNNNLHVRPGYHASEWAYYMITINGIWIGGRQICSNAMHLYSSDDRFWVQDISPLFASVSVNSDGYLLSHFSEVNIHCRYSPTLRQVIQWSQFSGYVILIVLPDSHRPQGCYADHWACATVLQEMSASLLVWPFLQGKTQPERVQQLNQQRQVWWLSFPAELADGGKWCF